LLEASDSEFSRAMWFWLRRPKLIFHGSGVLMLVALCVLISLSVALVNWHLTSTPQRVADVIIILFEVVVEVYAIGQRLKFLRWRRDYERSIDRLIRTIHPGCGGGSAIEW
jgi:membrane protein YdbS with pleckstrin-like domain